MNTTEILKYATETGFDLGVANGWGKTTTELFEALREFKIPGSESGTNLGRCYNAYEFKVLIDGIEHKVVYRVDSSD